VIYSNKGKLIDLVTDVFPASAGAWFLLMQVRLALRCGSSAKYCAFVFIPVDTIQSLVGFILFTALLLPWTFTFAIGGEKLIGPSWTKLAVYVIMPENLS
jgi:hypothetical protein